MTHSRFLKHLVCLPSPSLYHLRLPPNGRAGFDLSSKVSKLYLRNERVYMIILPQYYFYHIFTTFYILSMWKDVNITSYMVDTLLICMDSVSPCIRNGKLLCNPKYVDLDVDSVCSLKSLTKLRGAYSPEGKSGL